MTLRSTLYAAWDIPSRTSQVRQAKPCLHRLVRGIRFMKTDMKTMAGADWDRVTNEVVRKIQLLKFACRNLEQGKVEDRIAQDLILPAVAKLGEFCTMIELDGDDQCSLCGGQGFVYPRWECDVKTVPCPKCSANNVLSDVSQDIPQD